MDQVEMKRRTKELGKSAIALCRQLTDNRENHLIGNQLFRCATSVGSNYRAACRGRSKAEFIAKLGVALEETDETLYWLELLSELAIAESQALADSKGS